MGAYCSRAKPYKIIFQGLDAAGKTTILYQLKHGDIVTTIPTIGFNVEQVSVGDIEIVAWDLGGRVKIRPLYRHYYPNTDGFVFIIDSNDRERLDDALDELNRFILNEDETREKVVMILANKQDLEGALSLEEIDNKLKAKISSQGTLLGERIVFVKGCSAVTKAGLEDAFSLFSKTIKKQKAGKVTPGFKTVESVEMDYGKTTEVSGKDENQSHFHFLKKMFNIPYVKSLLFY